MVIGLSLNQKTDTDVTIPNLNARDSVSDMIRSYEEETEKFNFDCHFYKKDLFDITISFIKQSDVLTTSYTDFDATTNKIETI